MNEARQTRRATPVAIVGGGPVGLMLAMFLDRHGVDCVVFNQEASVRAHPKGSTHNSRTMEHYRRLGFADRVREAGLPDDHPTDVAYFTRFNAWELARIRMPSEAQKRRAVLESGPLEQIPEPIHRANQMYVEKILFDEASRRPHITLRFGWQVDAFEETPSSVAVRAKNVETGEQELWDASYMAACDGGRSFVRTTLGIEYEGYENLKQAFFGGRMISTYLRAPTLYRDFLGDKRAWQYWIVNPEIRTALVPLNGVDEFLLWSRDDISDNEIDDKVIAGFLKKCVGADVPVEVLAHGKWTAGVALVAEKFASGKRIFLAGDAVHLFTPTGGFGMNTGVDDAANLAWKLAAAVQGWGGDSLLASYEAERKPIAVRNTGAARALAKNVGQVPVPPELEDESDAGANARRASGDFLSTFGDEYASLGVQLGARYDGSPVVVANREAPPDDLSKYMPSSVPGGRAPHFWVDDGRGQGSSAYDHFGVGFTLLAFKEIDGGAQPEIAREAARRNIPFTVYRVSNEAARRMYGVDYALVRPDQHIAWSGDSLPAASGALWDRVTGRLT
ncbi:MAG: monooxygenase [Noviherbaspirillum sp.]|nr:monooxygenase [Noviherbaspirillum sp.]